MRIALLLALAFLLAAATCVLWRSPWNYAAQDRDNPSAGMSHAHPAGTDELGRDRLVRTSSALLLGAAGSLLASAFASTATVALAVLAGFAARWLGETLLYLGDLFLTLPWMFLLMMVRSTLPFNMAPIRSAVVTFVLLGFLGIPAFLRLHTTRLRQLRAAEWRLQDRAAGLRRGQSLQRLLPHLRPLLLTQFVLYIPACLIAEANLGTLGLGVSEPLASWGSMLQALQNNIFVGDSRWTYLPLLLLVLVLTCLELLIFNKAETLE